MIMLAPFVADRVRVLVPTAVLSLSMVPFATVYLPIGAASWLLPKRWIQSADNFIYRAYMRTTLFVFENISAVKLSLYGDIDALKGKEETVLIISNHQSDVDWAAINMLATRQSPNGCESGLRFMVKHVIHFVPLFGWYILQHGYVYVRRFGAFAPEPVLQQLKHLCSLGEPFWLHIFPEGTRFTFKKPDLIMASRKHCEMAQRRILKHLLAPRAKAFSLAVDNLRGSLDAIYDVTLAYSSTDSQRPADWTRGKAPNMLEFCGSSTPYRLHIHLRRIPIDQVPNSLEAQKKWLHDRFAEKDKLLETFYTEGAFVELVEANAPKLTLHRNLVPFLCFTAAITVLPVVSRKVRIAYLTTVAISPLLIGWLHIRKSV